MKHLENLEYVINDRITSVWCRFVKIYPKLAGKDRPSFALSNRLYRSAGNCSVMDRHITLAYKFFVKPQNYAYMMEHVIPHEIAHQVAVDLFGLPKNNRWHGSEWQKVMLDYGLVPSTYHPMTL